MMNEVEVAKQSSSLLTIINSKGGSSKRGLALTKTIPPLKEVLEFQPEVRVLSSPGDDDCTYSYRTACGWCFRLLDKPRNAVKCPKCPIFRYCNEFCLLASFVNDHEQECPILSSLAAEKKGSQVGDVVRSVVRLFFKCEGNKRFKKRILDLTSHEENFYSGEDFDIINADIEATVSAISKVLKDNRTDEMGLYIRRLFCITLVNSNLITNETNECVGVCVDPTFSLINHSCAPNTFIIPTSESSLSLISSSKLREGEEITTNYCYTSWPRALRKLQLRSRFFFECSCSVCQSKHDLFFSYNCAHCQAIVCSLSFEGVFSDRWMDTWTYNEKKLQCEACGRPIDFERLRQAQVTHKLIISYLFFSSYLPGSSLATESFEMFSRDLSASIEDNGFHNMDAETFSHYVLHIPTGSIDIPRSHLSHITHIFTCLLDYEVIPEYCFPLNYFFSALAYQPPREYLKQKDQIGKSELDIVLMRLQFDIKLRIHTDLASDLTQASVSKFGQFLDLAESNLRAIQELNCFNEKDWHTSLWNGSKQKLVNVLITVSYFFCIQTVDIFTKVSDSFGKSIPHLFRLITILNHTDIARRLAHKPVAFPQTSLCVTEGAIQSELKAFFDFVGGPFYWKSGHLEFCFADRARRRLFTSINHEAISRLKSLQPK